MSLPNQYFTKIRLVTQCLINTDSYQATKYLSPNEVITATRLTYGRKIGRFDNIDFRVKVGKPNYRERMFIKLLKKAKEPFPVSRIQLRPFPKKRNVST